MFVSTVHAKNVSLLFTPNMILIKRTKLAEFPNEHRVQRRLCNGPVLFPNAFHLINLLSCIVSLKYTVF